MPSSQTIASTDLQASLDHLLKSRRATRHFDRNRTVSRESIEEVLDLAHWAPSGFNLQPTHYILIENPAKSPELAEICYSQSQLYEANWVVVFVGDARSWREHRERVAEMDIACGGSTPEYAAQAEKMIVSMFTQFTPIDMKVWLTKQVALSAMQLMIAAESRGIATAPMEGFREEDLKRHLGVPQENTIPMIVCAGYSVVETRKSRLPLKVLLRQEKW